ncbi:unnamed protein product, partial [marine sediment metagenome]
VEVVATSRREGSLIVDTLVNIQEVADQLPIVSTDHLLDFLRLCSEETWQTAIAFFNDISEIHDTINDYFRKYPLNLALFVGLVPLLLRLARRQKKSPEPSDKKVPERIAKELYMLVQRNGFGQAVFPIVNETAVSIEVSTDPQFHKHFDKIDHANVENLLGRENEILPELRDGHDCQLKGEITSLKSTRGDSLTFHLEQEDKTYNLDLLPPEGKTTKSYTQFYKEHVSIKATVKRVSLYKKPKLHLGEIALVAPK